ncbi:unnamed protein product [Adineta ricciae]|uniref:Uncharacterized protein n=1 Tax=Adineta ricciae TaxID=249248 RepID=A0A816B8L7_ADIRI|nr:unnamed protein product [Adineta ricciae]
MNYSGGPGIMQPPMLPSIPPLPPPMPYANQGPISMVRPPSMYDPGYQSYPRRRPVRIHRRPRRSRRCRPVVRIIESSSCSSLSSYTTVSSCSPRRCRSRSHSHRCRGSSSAAPQQPIILLPMQCQQPAAAAAAVAAPAAPAQLPLSVQAQTQAQPQPQQIILPPIRIQQSGQYNQQPFTIPPMTVSQLGGQIQQPQQQSVTLSPMTISQITGQIQQQQPQQAINLAPMRFGSPNILSNTNANSMVIQSGQPFIQPSSSLPQVTTIGQPQQMQGSTIQYVQAAPQSSSSSTLQYISAQPRSTIAPQRVLVNSTNKKQAPSSKPVKRSVSTRELRQSDLKYGRRPFDWYDSNKQDNIINENVQVAQRRNTVMT